MLFHNQVKKRGVKVTDPLTDQWWGDRTSRSWTPFGYQIWFYQTVGEIKPPQARRSFEASSNRFWNSQTQAGGFYE